MKYVFDHLQLRTLNKSNVNNERLLLFSFKISGTGYGGRSHVPGKQTHGCDEEWSARRLGRRRARKEGLRALRCHRPLRAWTGRGEVFFLIHGAGIG